jgi:hypothetical protein
LFLRPGVRRGDLRHGTSLWDELLSYASLQRHVLYGGGAMCPLQPDWVADCVRRTGHDVRRLHFKLRDERAWRRQGGECLPCG